jgi:hypothetical protein
MNLTGQRVGEITLLKGSQTIDIRSYQPGIYFIKSTERVAKFIKY